MKRILLGVILVLGMASPVWAARQFTTKSADGVSGFIPPTSDCVEDISLVANTAKTVTWPISCGGNGLPASFAVFSAGSAFWLAASGQTAQVPSGDVLTGNGSMLNPGQVSFGGDLSLSLISATSQVISISFYSQSN